MKLFHKFISVILQPLLIPTYAMALLVNMEVFNMLPKAWHWVAIAGTLLFTCILPVLPVLHMMWRGTVTDLFISKRQQRTIPYLFSFIAYGFWVFFLWHTLMMPHFIVYAGIGCMLSIMVVLIINLKWKISAHATGIGGVTAAVIGVSYRLCINPVGIIVTLFILSALVALSRLELKAHNGSQILAGYVLGFVMVLVPALFL